MKSSLIAIVVASVLLAIVVTPKASAGGLIPMFDYGYMQAQVSGYTHLYYLPESAMCPRPDKVGIPDDESDFQWGLCRLKIDASMPDSPFGGFYEFELVDIDDSGANWLRRAELTYKVNDAWLVRAGRLFMASSYATPSAASVETVRSPRMSSPLYAYGVQAAGDLGSGVSILSDITGNSGVSFDSDDNWNRVESSTRIQKQISEDLFVAGTAHLSEDFGRAVLDGGWRLGSVCLRVAGYTKYESVDGRAENKRGFYQYVGYEILPGLEVHGQYDHQVGDDDIWTIGSRIWAPKVPVELTVDYEFVPDADGDNRVVARLEGRF
ncbi:MAG TPA: hypothetical protein P5328_02340 [Candidatus Paceibacterota bacterium]|nr:hypothetical protein [Candidatus Paceibacterota bacterium]HRZ34408.1 hypothetical protein [Candidatus Paceibacterota bacterium]